MQIVDLAEQTGGVQFEAEEEGGFPEAVNDNEPAANGQSYDLIVPPVKTRFRSGFEEKLAKEIEDAGLPVKYETCVLNYVWPARSSTYCPDFEITTVVASTS